MVGSSFRVLLRNIVVVLITTALMTCDCLLELSELSSLTHFHFFVSTVLSSSVPYRNNSVVQLNLTVSKLFVDQTVSCIEHFLNTKVALRIYSKNDG